jgi:hypothetical protein
MVGIRVRIGVIGFVRIGASQSAFDQASLSFISWHNNRNQILELVLTRCIIAIYCLMYWSFFSLKSLVHTYRTVRTSRSHSHLEQTAVVPKRLQPFGRAICR